MYKLSETDKRIIYELGRDARQSYKAIARSIRSKTEVVAYHIQQLVKQGVITQFVPVISLTQLGIYTFKIYLKLHGLTKEIEQKLIEHLVNNPDVTWVAKTVGNWDLLIALYSPDIITFAQKKNQILSEFSHSIAGYDITMIEDAIVFNRDYLTNQRIDYRTEFVFGGDSPQIAIEDDEKELLRLIRNDGRFQLRDIAQKLRVDPRTTAAKIKKLERLGVIQGYTTFISLSTIGLQLYKLCISLTHYNEKELVKIISYAKQNSSLLHIIKAIGAWELEFELESSNLASIYSFMNELKNNFPQSIKNINLVTITEELKLEFFPSRF